ncbi:hypothetical protein SAMN05444359_10643 [Neolewinella agarilytica]|uniref:Tetratricopeptide repeat-containing protein n=2 Tax=Neolewinella agarilytica TaxID=478744 RepID=A0A1H9DKQ4_9BACT|nr:hypothetical protein SAMN05444359_10643 [Neolewinella agarilytica]
MDVRSPKILWISGQTRWRRSAGAKQVEKAVERTTFAPMQQQGQHLAELSPYYHALRGPFLQWAAKWQQPAGVALGHLRRALIGWYEARIDEEDAYVGEVDRYVKTVAKAYFNGNLEEAVMAAERLPLVSDLGVAPQQNPLNHLPRPVRLNETQQLMLRTFQEMGTGCQELLLMADYHHLSVGRMAQILEVDGQLLEVEERRSKCLLMIREGWQSVGIIDPLYLPSPADEDLIDRYYEGELDTTERWDVEARRPGDAVFRRAMELREDWQQVVTVAGRQDLMETLLREEATYAKKTAPAPASAPKDVKLSPRRGRSFNFGTFKLPALETVVAVLLAVVFGWLVWTTFGDEAPQKKSVAHFEPFPNIFDKFDPRNEQERDLQRILYYYDRKDYATAYEELLPVAPAYPAAPLYLGVSALALEQPTRALDWFAQIPEGDYYHPFAEWYEALAYLAEGRRPAAEATLSEIVETRGHPYRGKAERLLAEL